MPSACNTDTATRILTSSRDGTGRRFDASATQPVVHPEVAEPRVTSLVHDVKGKRILLIRETDVVVVSNGRCADDVPWPHV